MAGLSREERMSRAIKSGEQEKALALLDSGADPLREDIYSGTRLHQAAAMGLAKLCAALLDRGADIKSPNMSKNQPLHLAAAGGHEQACRLLIQRKAPVNARGEQSATPLYLAAAIGRADICEMLLAAKARPNMKCRLDRTALHAAAAAGDFETCRVLVEGKADVSMRDKYEETPLRSALCDRPDQPDREKIVSLLAEAGADPNARNSMGIPCLHEAAKLRDLSLLRALLRAGANIEEPDPQKKTALYVAATRGSAEAVRMLLEWGASPHGGLVGHWHSPLAIAGRSGFGEIVAMLTAALEKEKMGQEVSSSAGEDGEEGEKGRAEARKGRKKGL